MMEDHYVSISEQRHKWETSRLIGVHCVGGVNNLHEDIVCAAEWLVGVRGRCLLMEWLAGGTDPLSLSSHVPELSLFRFWEVFGDGRNSDEWPRVVVSVADGLEPGRFYRVPSRCV